MFLMSLQQFLLDQMAEKEIGKNASLVIGICFEECLGH